MNMTKHEAARAYARNGWKVFPCAPDSKVPMAGVSHGVKDATDDIAQIDAWWSANPNANIGLACGAASGIGVVDVDVKPEKGVDGFASVRAAGLEIPDTLAQTTPSGGRHFLFALPPGLDLRNAQGVNGLKGVDVRGHNGYIVVAPSSIGGKAYAWVKGVSSAAPYPEAFVPKQRTGSVFDAVPPSCTVPSAPATDRARAYLAEIPGAVEGANGHGTLFWVAQVLVNGFRLTDGEAEELMWSEFNPRCLPPWERTPATEREFRHKIAEAHAKPNPEACAIYDAMPDRVTEDDFDFDQCIADVRALLAPRPAAPSSVPVTKREAAVNGLLLPDGLVGDIAKWMNDTAMCYQPLLSLGAALTLCGAIMGRKVCDESNGRTNIYCMGVGPSSSGKDHPGDCINAILKAAGAQDLMMGRMTSDTAIEKALLAGSHVKLAVLDEVGHFFSNINAAGDGSAYLKTIKPTLMELFSSAHKTYIGKEKATGSAPLIDQPCMCIWGVTAPEKLYAGMTIEELQDGWIARNLVFLADDKIPDIVMKPAADVPESIAGTVRSWFMRTGSLGVISAVPGGEQKPLVVPMDERARARFTEFNVRTRNFQRAAHDKGDKTQYLWGKALQNARRIALIVACGKEYENPVIGEYEANYGCRLVECLVKNAIQAVAENVNENKWEEEKKRVLAVVTSYGKSGASGAEICRRTQWVRDGRHRTAILTDLAEAGLVVARTRTGIVGRPSVRWYASPFAQAEELEQGVEHVDAE